MRKAAPTIQLFISLLLFTKSFAFATPSRSNHKAENPIETVQIQKMASSSDNEQVGDQITSSSDNDNGVQALPASDPNDDSIPKLKFGETLRLEAFGPIILNTDGTTRRIDNWDQLTEKEQEVTWRRIRKRNEERRKILLEQAEKEAADSPSANDTSDAQSQSNSGEL